ncbi:M949_RS01915 family surface polysaccharide biosynthesis protein [Maribacter sp. Asnod2-G09]|uniref:M949_RS01915 family surface polysaccharide biosynthesis protein n=1 Tax=Maribacter sp. Asnod2-G09 TaxID=3160577 RepID=UPI00386FBEC9
MKNIITLLILIATSFSFAQSEENKEKFRTLEPDIWLGIWDRENSSKEIKIDSLNYNEIPKSLDFKGTVVEALKWKDANGENILIQTVTGNFTWMDYEKDSTDYMLQDKAELYAYLFVKSNTQQEYKRQWRVYDYIECFGVDWFIGFAPKATTITDLDNDGITEIAMPYVAMCRGGMDPGIMKIIMFEENTKYAFRGETMLMCGNKNAYGGEYEASSNLEQEPSFNVFLKQHWNRNKCEEGKYY